MQSCVYGHVVNPCCFAMIERSQVLKIVVNVVWCDDEMFILV